MKLKGKNSERIREDKKEKMQATLNKMQENRNQDNVYLRDVIKKKLEWAAQEKEKGEKFITQLELKIKETKEKVTRLEGILIVLDELKVTQLVKKEETDGNS